MRSHGTVVQQPPPHKRSHYVKRSKIVSLSDEPLQNVELPIRVEPLVQEFPARRESQNIEQTRLSTIPEAFNRSSVQDRTADRSPNRIFPPKEPARELPVARDIFQELKNPCDLYVRTFPRINPQWYCDINHEH